MASLMGRSSRERQSHPFKPIGSTTNKHVEEAPAPPSRPDADEIWRAGERRCPAVSYELYSWLPNTFHPCNEDQCSSVFAPHDITL